MNSKQTNITANQFSTFILSAQIGVGILTLPSILAKESGHDSWISILIAGFIFFLFAMAMVLLLHKYKDKSILDINQLLYTRFIGTILNIFIVTYLFFAASLALRIFTSVINISVLLLTPSIIIAALLLLPTIHMSWYGLKSICRFDRIIIFIVPVVLLFYIVFFDKVKLTFLMPVGQANTSDILNGALLSSSAFLGIELTAILYPYITDKKNVMKNVLYSNLFATLFFVITTIILIAVFGENQLKHFLFPLFTLAAAYKAPILERLDLFFISLWLPAMGVSMTAYYYCTLNCLEKLIPIKKRYMLHILFAVSIIFASRIPKDIKDVFRYVGIINKLGIGINIFFIFSLAFSYVNRNGVQK